jgi:hypothetical protein
MMTWQLWRLFYRTSPRHPLFWYRFDSLKDDAPERRQNPIVRVGRLILSLLMPLLVWFLFLPLLLVLPTFLFFAGAFGSALTAYSVSRQVMRERETGRYEQIAVTPSGDFGVASAVAMRVLRQQRNLRQFLRLIRAIHVILFMTAFAIGLINLLLLPDMRDQVLQSGLPVLLVTVSFIGILQLDLIQAMLTGALVGMLSPTILRRADTPFLAVCFVLLLQFGLYIVVAILIKLVQELFNLDADVFASTEGLLLICLIGLAAVYLVHEAILSGMWRILADRLNFNPKLLMTTVMNTERHGS